MFSCVLDGTETSVARNCGVVTALTRKTVSVREKNKGHSYRNWGKIREDLPNEV